MTVCGRLFPPAWEVCTMKHGTILRFCSLLLLLFALGAAQSAAPSTQESAAGSELRLLEGWTVETDHPELLSVAAAKGGVRTEGKSLMMSHAGYASTALLSEPLQLDVGQLYRLAGWIKTEGVRSDPTTRYPTAVPACLSMASFPFTNHSPTVGGNSTWTRVETLFIATRSKDRIRLHLGHNGGAAGKAWFTDASVEKVQDIGEYIPMETVRWFGNAYRYDDRGWIFVHIEGEPYERGYQYGYLVADEIVEYILKLGVQRNEHDPESGWRDLRFMSDAMLLRKFDEEYLTEMKGIAEGAARAGAEIHGRKLDFLDIVTINSFIDLRWIDFALGVTPHQLTGRSFLAADDELDIPDGEHSCSAFVATGPATASGEIVFGQIFMWWGYTGVHWNVICDVVPSSGHRLVYETYPGGIHSGADFYMNSAGIVIGETTVGQTPYDPTGTPQSNRIRKAAQYASSIDEVVEILSTDNNGMYTNDWPIADIKTGEAAILLLGTHVKKLWRTGEDMAPFGTPGFLWANNNNRDPEVRKEYITQPEDAPYDLIFSPWNRDVAFNDFYRRQKGKIDSTAAVELWASSPVNMAHACDGKITTSEMAREMVFLAHYGKVTLREKIPEKGSRRMPDLPGAIPHLSLGYSVVSPLFITEKLQQARKATAAGSEESQRDPTETIVDDVSGRYDIDSRHLWRNTIFPATAAENWLISGSAAYWRMLHGMAEINEDDGVAAAADSLSGELARLNARYLYTISREADLAPVKAERAYDRFGPYRIPLVKGVFALHQLRLLLGNETFLEVMNGAYTCFASKEITVAEFISVAEELAERPLDSFLRQWIERQGLPVLQPTIKISKARKSGWKLKLTVEQKGDPYHLLTSIEVEAGGTRRVLPVEIEGAISESEFFFQSKPEKVLFNAYNDIPAAHDDFYTWSNFIDDFHDTLIVHGTSRQIEANHTIAKRWQTTLADAYVEILPPVVKDGELTAEELASHDLIILGSPDENSLTGRLAEHFPVEFEKNMFRWQGETYAEHDDGIFIALPNPYNEQRVIYLFAGNSALQLYKMTELFRRGIPSWALFKSDEIVDEGYHRPEEFVIGVND
jgi:hypothetical protein